MTLGVCTFPLIACRREPNERSEMVSQLVYGEKYEVLDDNGQWLQIRNLRDDYESWIDAKLNSPISVTTSNPVVLENPFNTYVDADSISRILPAGAIVDGEKYQIESLCSLTETAQKFIDAPYLWGGKSIWGIDCSGFIQTVFQIHGINISRDAYQQAEWGDPVEFAELIEKVPDGCELEFLEKDFPLTESEPSTEGAKKVFLKVEHIFHCWSRLLYQLEIHVFSTIQKRIDKQMD